MERLHVIVEGIVQGVGFRQFTLHEAQRLRLGGWVKNRYDRRVEVVAEGMHDHLAELLSVLSEGPPASVVQNVHVTWEKATGEFSTFSIS
jgi:acylphosphatase